jgi:hypothetical protein
MGIRLALHRGAGRTAVPVRSAVASAAVGVAALSAAIVFAASLSHLLASPALYGVTWHAAVTNNSGTGPARWWPRSGMTGRSRRGLPS